MTDYGLRKGNYFYHGSIATVVGIAEDGIIYCYNGIELRKVTFAGVKYLRLSEDIVLCLGFQNIQEESTGYYKSPVDPKVLVRFFEGKWYIGYRSANDRGFSSNISLDYVHQLQNAHYDMTRCELTLKRNPKRSTNSDK